MARYCCDRGNRLVTTFTDGSVTSFGYRQTGDVYLTLPDKLNDLQTSQQALPLDNKSISEEIALQAKNVKNMNEGV